MRSYGHMHRKNWGYSLLFFLNFLVRLRKVEIKFWSLLQGRGWQTQQPVKGKALNDQDTFMGKAPVIPRDKDH